MRWRPRRAERDRVASDSRLRVPSKLMRWPVWLAALAVALSATGCEPVHVEKPPPLHPPHFEPPPFHPEKPPPIHPPPLHLPSPEATGFSGVVDKATAAAAGVKNATPAQVRQGVLSANLRPPHGYGHEGQLPVSSRCQERANRRLQHRACRGASAVHARRYGADASQSAW